MSYRFHAIRRSTRLHRRRAAAWVVPCQALASLDMATSLADSELLDHVAEGGEAVGTADVRVYSTAIGGAVNAGGCEPGRPVVWLGSASARVSA